MRTDDLSADLVCSGSNKAWQRYCRRGNGGAAVGVRTRYRRPEPPHANCAAGRLLGSPDRTLCTVRPTVCPTGSTVTCFALKSDKGSAHIRPRWQTPRGGAPTHQAHQDGAPGGAAAGAGAAGSRAERAVRVPQVPPVRGACPATGHVVHSDAASLAPPRSRPACRPAAARARRCNPCPARSTTAAATSSRWTRPTRATSCPSYTTSRKRACCGCCGCGC